MDKRDQRLKKQRAGKKLGRLAVFELLLLLFFTLVVCGIILYSIKPDVKEELTLEVDSSLPQVTDFLNKHHPDARFIYPLSDTVDMDTIGDYTVYIAVAGKEYTITLHIVDTQPPIIAGVKDMAIRAGDTVSYKSHIIVIDNYDEETSLMVDNSQVDLNTVGAYPITYIAEDLSGNIRKETTTLYVEEPDVKYTTEEIVNAEADRILAEIIRADMSEYQKAEKIFYWVYENIEYVDHSPKNNWIEGAYQGFFQGEGDCYIYAMTAKCLLDRAGIMNLDIEKIPDDSVHHWNLINLGDGWYHFDATNRVDGRYFFYTTDSELMEYSNAHNGSHQYDSARYPVVE